MTQGGSAVSVTRSLHHFLSIPPNIRSNMARLVGTWNLVESENFDEYMEALGVNFALRKMGSLAKPSQHISMEGDEMTIKTTSTFKNTEIKFKPNVEFDETTADGRKVKTTCKLEGDSKLIQEQKGEPDSVLTRERVDDSTMIMTLEAKGVKCTRKYNLQE